MYIWDRLHSCCCQVYNSFITQVMIDQRSWGFHFLSSHLDICKTKHFYTGDKINTSVDIGVEYHAAFGKNFVNFHSKYCKISKALDLALERKRWMGSRTRRNLIISSSIWRSFQALNWRQPNVRLAFSKTAKISNKAILEMTHHVAKICLQSFQIPSANGRKSVFQGENKDNFWKQNLSLCQTNE